MFGKKESGKKAKVAKAPSSESSAFNPEPDKHKEKADKKVKEGWIRSWMMVEALAINQDAVKNALERHIQKMGQEKGVMVSKKDFKKIEKVDKPFPNINTAYSGVVELEVLTHDYDKLVFIVLNYAPSAIEILEPKMITMGAGEAQGVLNSLAEMMHKFVSLTRGAILADVK